MMQNNLVYRRLCRNWTHNGYSTIWLDSLVLISPSYGYYVNIEKMWLVVKPQYLQDAVSAFSDTKVNITFEGRPYLTSLLGSDPYITNFVQSKVENWISILSTLTDITNSQPHTTYSTFVHVLSIVCSVGPH